MNLQKYRLHYQLWLGAFAMETLVTKRDMYKLLDLLAKEHDISLASITQERSIGYINSVSPLYQVYKNFPGIPTSITSLAELVVDPGPCEWDDGRMDNSTEVCELARELLLHPSSAPLFAFRGNDGTLLHFIDGGTDEMPKRYCESYLSRPWRYARESLNQTPDYRIIAEWILIME